MGSDGFEGHSLSPEEALENTYLLGRTGSETGDAGGGSRDLDLEVRYAREREIEGDLEELTVDGRPYREFLRETRAYRFASWMLASFPVELRETGSLSGMEALHEALLSGHRIEFRESIGDRPGRTDGYRFDLVVRDRALDPLIVADSSTSRDPLSERDASKLIEGARCVATEYESLAGAFLVTASYFEPGALEFVSESTAPGGLLERFRDRKSYVTLPEGTGFHVCLVEAGRNGFHVTVPEL